MTRIATAPTTVFPEPAVATAHRPAEWRGVDRDAVRLLVAHGSGITHARFRDLPAFLDPGDLLVVNNSATVAAQCDAELDGRPVVLHVAAHLGDSDWVVEIRCAPDAARAVLDGRDGQHIRFGDSAGLTILAPYPRRSSSPTGLGNRLWRARYHGPMPLRDLLARIGRPIAYGYLDRRYPLAAYQTVFGNRPGSAEMPSAARPFTPEVVTALVSRGVGIAPITLHTGVSSQEAGEVPQPEWFEVPETTACAVNSARAAGGRVVAVGTTATRALESAVDRSRGGDRVVARSGWTERVISTGDPARIVDGLISGWHDPHASHLLLVESVAGPGPTQRAYDAAAGEGYLWHEFGDSSLFLPPRAHTAVA